jgi:hypothetical protein
MNLTQEQKDQINNLVDCRDHIVSDILKIENILKVYFPQEYERAIQFYLPQITTALYEDKKWLSRGEYSLQNTIDNLLERCNSMNTHNGLNKYI